MKALRWHGEQDVRVDDVPEPKVDPSEIITHTGSLEDSPELWDTFIEKEDDCTKACSSRNGRNRFDLVDRTKPGVTDRLVVVEATYRSPVHETR